MHMSDIERSASGKSHGGMTGATGNLTPDEPDQVFMPAETREISDPSAARKLTASAHRRAEGRQAENDDDPVYRVDEQASPSAEGAPALDRSPMLGGDERHDPEDEHF
jgi:hypothetical protein